MTTKFTELRSQAMHVDTATAAPSGLDQYGEAEVVAGRIYFDTATGKLYVYTGSAWKSAQLTSTSTSSTSSSSSSSSTSSTSISTSSTSTSSTSSSTSSSSTSTTLY